MYPEVCHANRKSLIRQLARTGSGGSWFGERTHKQSPAPMKRLFDLFKTKFQFPVHLTLFSNNRINIYRPRKTKKRKGGKHVE